MQAYSKELTAVGVEALSDPQPASDSVLATRSTLRWPSMANSVNPASILRLAVKPGAYDRANHDVCGQASGHAELCDRPVQ